ncbi:hypothetical protein ACFWAP_03910 [Streptomyces goshikiensis]|uniref:hypothetical protein n=1 Tax=Streptomyces goshikiensis TaxID=1942 RepID=UPI00365B4093
MNPDPLPLLADCLRTLGGYPDRYEVNTHTLAEIAAELDRGRSLVAAVRGQQRANSCVRHPGGPIDPTAENGCLLCGNDRRRPARPIPDDFVPGDVLQFLAEHGHDAATERYGPLAVAKALALGDRHPSTRHPSTRHPSTRHPSTRRPGPAAGPHDEQGEQH